MNNKTLKDLMTKYKITYRVLAKVLNISYGHLCDMVNGKKTLQKKYTQKIEEIFKGEDNGRRDEGNSSIFKRR